MTLPDLSIYTSAWVLLTGQKDRHLSRNRLQVPLPSVSFVCCVGNTAYGTWLLLPQTTTLPYCLGWWRGQQYIT